MATSPLGGFASLVPAQAELSRRQAASTDPLTSLIQGFQTGQAIQRLPQTMAEDALSKQLALAIQQANLAKLQRPQIFEVGGSLVTEDPNSPTGVRTLFSGPSRTAADRASFVGFQTQPDGSQVPVEYSATEGLRRVKVSEGLGGNVASQFLPKTQKPPSSAKGGLTENRKSLILQQYGKVQELVGPIDDPKFLNESGQMDFSKLATAIGAATRTQDLADLSAKQSALPAGLRDDAAGWISAQKELVNLKSKLTEIGDEEPGMLQNAAAVVASQPSTGWLSSLSRQVAGMALSENTKDKEVIRSGLKTAIQTALSGKTVSKNEEQSLTGMLPLADDTINDLIRKSAALDSFLSNKLAGLSESGSLGRTVQPSPSPSVTTVPATSNLIKTKQEFDALPSGSVYTRENGKTYQKP